MVLMTCCGGDNNASELGPLIQCIIVFIVCLSPTSWLKRYLSLSVFATRVCNTLEATFTSHYPRTGLTTCQRTLDLRGRIAEIIVYSLRTLGTTAYTTRYREVTSSIEYRCAGNALDHGNQDLIRDFHCIPLRIREVEL